MLKLIIKIVLFFIITLSPILLFANVTAKISQVKGSVTVLAPGQKEVKINTDTEVPQGTVIKTGITGSLVINLLNTTSSIKPLSMIKISEIGIEEDSNNIDFQLKRGTLKSRVEQIEGKKTSFKVKTPVSTLSVRGTEIEVSHGPNFGTDMKTFTGIADMEDKSGNKRQVAKDQSASVQNNTAPTTQAQENSKSFTVKVAPEELTPTEQESIQNSTEILPDPPAEAPLEVVQSIIDIAKTTKINTTLMFQD